MLRLNQSTLSLALGAQMIEDEAHLRIIYEQELVPLVSGRLRDRTLQRANAGSVGLGSALTLFLLAYRRAPLIIAEVGTYIGNSAAAMALGAGTGGVRVQLITCDINPCIQDPLQGLPLPKGSAAQVVQGSSTQMFQAMLAEQLYPDLLHLDGRIMQNDLSLIAKLIKDDTVIALDDCMGDEKGHINLDLLRRSGIAKQHVFVEPFPREIFRMWGLETRSGTGILLPTKLISYARQ